MAPHSLLLDGQQRMTSLYQVTLRGKVVETVTPKNKKVKRWFYIDIRQGAGSRRSTARKPSSASRRTGSSGPISAARSFWTCPRPSTSTRRLMYPVAAGVRLGSAGRTASTSTGAVTQHESVRDDFRAFKRQVLENFKYYRVPVISLDRSTSKEAVCVVFEKVNTGGKPLDAFELVTAMYAAAGHELRKDWYGDDGSKGRHRRFADTLRPADSEAGIVAGVSNTDFLQAISLFYTRERRRAAEAQARTAKNCRPLPATGRLC